MNVAPVVPASSTLPIHQYIAISISLPSMILYIVTVVLIVRARIRDRLFNSPFFSLILVQIWSKKAVFLCLLVQWAVPVAINGGYFAAGCRGDLMSTYQSWFFVALSTGICLICYGVCYSLSSRQKKLSDLEQKLLLCSILQAIPMFAEFLRTLISFLLLYVFKTDQYDADSWVVKFWSEILYYYIDTSVTIQPYCLLITNTHVRKLFLCRKRNNVIKIWTNKLVFICFGLEWGVPVAINLGYFIAGCRGDLVDIADIRSLYSTCSTQKKLSELEQKLLICSVLQALPMFTEFLRTIIQFLLLYVFMIENYTADSWVAKFWSEVLYYYIDTLVTIPPYCLLLTNTHVRRLFLCRKKHTVKGSSATRVSSLGKTKIVEIK
ncbi:unnamed protein product, partial [Mesorhabditis spiculigera]